MNKAQNPSKSVQSFGQSIWYDNIRRSMFDSGELAQLISEGVMGITSNPTIFEKAINGSRDYDDVLRFLMEQNLDPDTIFEKISIEDVQIASDLLFPVYQKTDGKDGYVSLEVKPELAYDTQGTIEEAKRLFQLLDRPNVMIKVPATPEGIAAIEPLISGGININVTLIFSIAQYQAVARAYIAGLEKRLNEGSPIEKIASVASFFLSRIDTAVDKELDELDHNALRGKIAIASAKVAYGHFQEFFSGDQWETLQKNGAQVQRPLWASTSTKNPAYPDTMYVEALIGPDTVNTLPPATLVAFNNHGAVRQTLDKGLPEAQASLDSLESNGVDLQAINSNLLSKGVDAFRESYKTLIESINAKQSALFKTQ